MFVLYMQKLSFMKITRRNSFIKTIGRQGSLFLLMLLFAMNMKAQQDTIVPVETDPEELLKDIDLREFNQPSFNLWHDDFKGHWAGFGVGINLFVDEDYSAYSSSFMENDVFRSNSAYINVVEKSFGLQRNRNTIGLVTGAGIHLQSYRLKDSITIRRMVDGTIEPQALYFDQNQKSKFAIVSLMVPLLAEFQIPLSHYKNRIYFSGGIYGSIRLGSHTKVKYRSEGKKYKLKTPGHYSLQDFKYGLMVRAGYRWFNFFATYELVPLFKENKGPELTPVTFGVTIISF